jgi:iron transport multicopper oxidase
MGCIADPAGGPFAGHFMPLLFRNDSVNVELCISVALARRTAIPATTFKYIGLEYGRECYAATATPTGTAAPATTTGPSACTMRCKGDTAEFCGGRNQMNLYSYAPTPTK